MGFSVLGYTDENHKNSMIADFGKESVVRTLLIPGLILEHITILNEVRILSG